MKTTVKFLFSTLVAAAAMTSTAWAEGTTVAKADNVEYSSFQEAVTSVKAGEIKIVADTSEVLTTDLELIADGDLFISAEKTGSVSLLNNGTSYDLILGGNGEETLTVGENVTIDVVNRIVWAGYYGNNAKLKIDGSLSGAQLWMGLDTTVSSTGSLESYGEAMVFRRGATLDVQGGKVKANYFNFLSGNLTAKDAEISGGAIWINNTGAYTGESSVRIRLDNTTWESTGNLKMTSDATALLEVGNESTLTIALHDGSQSVIGKNSQLWVSNKSTLNSNKIEVSGGIDLYDATWNVYGVISNKGTIDVREGSLLNAKNQTIDNTGTIAVDNSALTAGTVVNNSANFFVNGDSSLVFGTISGSGSSRITYGYEQDGTTATAQKGTLVLNGNSITAGRVAFLNNVKLEKDLTIGISHETTYGGSHGLVRLGDGTLDLGGNTLTVKGQLVSSTETIKNGTIIVDGDSAPSGIKNLCFQRYGNVVAEDARIIAKNVSHSTFYGSTTVNGKIEIINETGGNPMIIGGGFDSASYASGSHLTVSGAEASLSQVGRDVKIYGIWGKNIKAVSSLTVEQGATFSTDKNIINDGIISISSGATLSAVNIVNNGSITLNNATLKVTGTITGSGTLTMLGSSKVDDGNSENGSGVEIQEISVATETGSVSLAAGSNIVFSGVTEVTNAAKSEITTLKANVVIAWHFDVDANGELVTVETEIGAGLNANDLQIFHKGDEAGSDWTEADVSDVTYDAETGKLSFKTSSFSSYAVAIPEPSTFGLFAGLGALLLVGARRRRK